MGALYQRGYRSVKRRRARLTDYEELESPLLHVGQPLMGSRHSVFVGRNGGLRILRAGASLEYAMPLPDRTADLLLRR
jgi:hypothetical protein